MNCKTIHNKALEYVEKRLPEAQQQALHEHLKGCSECRQYINFIQQVYGEMEAEKNQEVNPFIATRIMQKHQAGERVQQRPVAVWLQNAVMAIVLAAGIFIGVNTGMETHESAVIKKQVSYSTTYYIDDIEQENIAVLLSE